jgi:hypothetical protein
MVGRPVVLCLLMDRGPAREGGGGGDDRRRLLGRDQLTRLLELCAERRRPVARPGAECVVEPRPPARACGPRNDERGRDQCGQPRWSAAVSAQRGAAGVAGAKMVADDPLLVGIRLTVADGREQRLQPPAAAPRLDLIEASEEPLASLRQRPVDLGPV